MYSRVKFNIDDDSSVTIALEPNRNLTRGYKFRLCAPDEEAMLFDMGHSDFHGFTMQNVNFDLDIIFIGENMEVLEIRKGTSNAIEPIYPTEKCRYVVETKYGFCDNNNITEGLSVEFLKIWD